MTWYTFSVSYVTVYRSLRQWILELAVEMGSVYRQRESFRSYFCEITIKHSSFCREVFMGYEWRWRWWKSGWVPFWRVCNDKEDSVCSNEHYDSSWDWLLSAFSLLVGAPAINDHMQDAYISKVSEPPEEFKHGDSTRTSFRESLIKSCEENSPHNRKRSTSSRESGMIPKIALSLIKWTQRGKKNVFPSRNSMTTKKSQELKESS